MKNLLVYYILAFTPLAILLYFLRTDNINSWLFVGLLLFYSLIYRTYIDGKRLADKNIISRNEIWKMVIPGKHIEHFRELYLKK